MSDKEQSREELIQELKTLRAELAQSESGRVERQQHLQSLSRRLLEVQEAERRHIARELHDEIGQALTAVKINLQATQQMPEARPVRSQLEESIAIVERALQQVRNLSLDLRPSLLDDLGLVSALRWYVDRQVKRTGIAIPFYAPFLTTRLATGIETTCFRIVQESLTNAFRHARASQIQVSLAVAGSTLELIIIDNGTGFDFTEAWEKALSGGSLGLLGMEERARLVGGELKIRSAPGEGTEVRVVIPL